MAGHLLLGVARFSFADIEYQEEKMSHKVLLTVFITLFLVACGQTEPGQMLTPEIETPDGQSSDSAGLPNPASVYCEEQGYRLEMREGEGGTYGVCLFPGGSECDEWAYFRGECQPGDSLATPATVPPVEVTQAEDGCQVYRNATLGYQFHFPADANIELGDDPLQALTVVGPLEDDEHWPMIYVSHPQNNEAYRPPADVNLAEWLVEHNLLASDGDELAAEVRQSDVEIAGTTAVHTRFERSPQSYAYDKYFFTRANQLFVVVILHTGDHEDWTLYSHFLENFEFTA